MDPKLNSFVLLETLEQEVKQLINSLKNNCAVGWNQIPNNILRKHTTFLIPQPVHTFNLCILTGVFPTFLKKSEILPIYKGGHNKIISNYRSISILPSLSKILEKMINIKFKNYLESNNILSNNQFGFRQTTTDKS